VRPFNAIAGRLLAAGVPMGPNGLISVAGRKTGLRRTTPVTIIGSGGRHWVIGVYGDVDWVRNLRASRSADVVLRGLHHPVAAHELGEAEAVDFFRDVFAPVVRRYGGLGAWIVRNVDKIDIADPSGAARGRPVFELVDQSG
jgi:deazaflavin-dependent oxidoreductase (nitroreductase family)